MEYVFALEKGHLLLTLHVIFILRITKIWYYIAKNYINTASQIILTNNYIVIVSFLPDIDEFWSIVLWYVEEHVRKTKAECNADPESQDKVLCQLRT